MSSWRFKTLGNAKAQPVIFLHGFLGDADDWKEVAEKLAASYYCILPELPGHGLEDAELPFAEYGFTDITADFKVFCEQFNTPRLSVVAYSLGGRLALAAALEYPALISKLVLVSASAGIADVEARKKRALDDEQRAKDIEEGGIESFLKHWYSLSVFSTLEDKPELKQRLIEKRSRLSPSRAAATLRAFGVGKQTSYWHRLPELETELLLICGAEDPKYVSVAEALRQKRGEKGTILGKVSDASHCVHLEQPERVANLLRGFLA